MTISTLRDKCEEIYRSLPDSLHYKSENMESTTAIVFCRQATLYLGFMYSRFLLDKILSGENAQPLLDTARLILDAVLALWKRRDCLWDYFQSDFDIFVRHILNPSP